MHNLTDRIKHLSRAIRWNGWPNNYKVKQVAEIAETFGFFPPILLRPEHKYFVYHYFVACSEGDFAWSSILIGS